MTSKPQTPQIQQIYEFLENKIQKPYSIKKKETIQEKAIYIFHKTEFLIRFKQNTSNKVEILIYDFTIDISNHLEFITTIINLLEKENFDILYDKKKFNEMTYKLRIKQHPNFKHTDNFLEKCEDATHHFIQLLNPNSKYYKRGILIYLNSNLIGIMKLKGNRNILAINFDNSNHKINPLENLHIYNTNSKLTHQLNKLSLKPKRMLFIFQKKDWLRFNLIGKFPINSRNFRELFDHNYLYFENKENVETTTLDLLYKVYNNNKSIDKFDEIIHLE